MQSSLFNLVSFGNPLTAGIIHVLLVHSSFEGKFGLKFRIYQNISELKIESMKLILRVETSASIFSHRQAYVSKFLTTNCILTKSLATHEMN